MNLFFVVLFSLISCFSYGGEYKLSSSPIECARGDSVVGFNANGQILFSHCPNGRLELFFTGYLDEDGKRSLIDYPDRNEFADVHLFPKMINNNGFVLGISCHSSKKGDDIGTSTPFMWVKNRGILAYNLSKVYSREYTVEDLNDLGWFVGQYRTKDNKMRAYLCKGSNCISDMGEKSDFWRHFGKIGYYVTDIHLSAINNSGQLAGWFSYAYYDPQNKKYITIGQEVFFWDGALMHVIPLPHSFQSPPIIKLNNTGSLIVRFVKPKLPYKDNTTFLWAEAMGLQEIAGFNGDKINDSNIIIGKDSQGVPAVWKNDHMDRILKISDRSKADRIIDVEVLIDINDNDQIISKGSLNRQTVFLIIESNEE